MASLETRQGKTSPILNLRIDGIDVADCTCQQALTVNENSTPVLTASITGTTAISGQDYFQVYLSPTQLTGVNVGNYVWAVDINCPTSSPPIRVEVHYELEVKKSVI